MSEIRAQGILDDVKGVTFLLGFGALGAGAIYLGKEVHN